MITEEADMSALAMATEGAVKKGENPYEHECSSGVVGRI